MQIYFFTAGLETAELSALEERLRSALPDLRRVAKIDEVTSKLNKSAPAERDQIFIVFPVLAAAAFDRILNITEQQEHRGVFFIFISKEISASDYKRLVRNGDADWVSLQGAPQEILDIVKSRTDVRSDAKQARPTIVTFVPSGGGVGNATLALETAVQVKLDQKKTRDLRVCLLDLDMQ